MAALTLYSDGTITFTNGSADIVGTGTQFAGLLAGDLVYGPDDDLYELASIADDTNATLTSNYAGTTVSNAVGGTDWWILKSSTGRDSVRTATKQLTDITNLYRRIINLTSVDQTLRLSKATAADRAGVILQKAGIDQFHVGSLYEDEYSIRYSLAAAWVKAFGVDPITGAVSIYSQLALKGVIAPPQLTATTNDYAPTGIEAATVIRLSAGSAQSLTGIAGGTDGRVLTLINVGASNITLKNFSNSSAAANRFYLPGDAIIASGASAILIYDGSASCWRQIAGGGNMIGVNNLAEIADQNTAQTNLGGTALGKSIFTAANADAVRASLDMTAFSSTGAYLASDTDLNTVIKNGNYYGSSLVNSPNPYGCSLTVVRLDPTYVYQRLCGHSDSLNWERWCVNNVWTNWFQATPSSIGRGLLTATNAAAARSVIGAVHLGGGSGMYSNDVLFGWNNLDAVLAQVDNLPLGKLWTDYGTANGANYFRLPNNKLVQWGKTETVTDAGGLGSLTYPIAFSSPTSPVSIVANAGGAAGSQNIISEFQDANWPTTTGFAFAVRVGSTGNGYASQPVRVIWVAIGT